eukprot:4319724-Amphidinium_carterae.1
MGNGRAVGNSFASETSYRSSSVLVPKEMNVQDFIMWHQEPSKKDVQRLSPERLAELWPLMSTGLF